METENDKDKRVVVCSACFLSECYPMLVGPRHWDDVMRQQFGGDQVDASPHWVQGFIDQYGKFMDRREAFIVAEKAGQIIKRVGGDKVDGGTLYSENLY